MNINQHLSSTLFLSYTCLVSGLIINFLQLCSCLIWPFNKQLFRKISCYLALAIKRLQSISDVTVGFKKTDVKPTLLSILKGRACQAELFVERFPISEIPTDTEGSNNWIHELYCEKNKIYDSFVQYDTFAGNGLPSTEISHNYYDLLIELG
ncbi:unnamed protein product [Rotaria sp. Silwood1]|nr:unnamed protein product [Rotaria sp. Silwood1]CAF3544364.1 unnamed protein product [Rotaria sp. Silwood1]CAF3601919.1 unnamed protein product [Rotaria sp. Silwood1]CAF4690589.1 unnamed protein product [Rotaria sp. Silwood1]CAF4721558.1 unnamed protein product [Rotaria sp. Silwood1]